MYVDIYGYTLEGYEVGLGGLFRCCFLEMSSTLAMHNILNCCVYHCGCLACCKCELDNSRADFCPTRRSRATFTFAIHLCVT